MKRQFSAILLWAGVLCMYAAPSMAQSFDYTVYVDNDNNAASGCTEAGFQGAEVRLRVSVTGGAAPSLAATTKSVCSAGVFGGGSALNGTAALGFDAGVAGSDVIEFDTDEAGLRNGPSAMRVGVIASSANGEDTLFTVDGGGGHSILFGQQFVPVPAIGIPLLALLAFGLLALGARRSRSVQVLAVLMLLSSVAWAAQHISDGTTVDWSGTNPRAQDPGMDPTSGEAQIDLRALYAAISNGRVYWRIDVTDMQSHLPVADAAAETTLEDAPLTITLTGSDPASAPLTFAIASMPGQGMLGAIVSTGPDRATVQYTPDVDANGNDSFAFTVENGVGISMPATVTVVVTAVNDAPGFVAQNPPAINEDAGAQLVQVATSILPGPVTATDEAAQSLDFTLVSNSNPALFVVAPSIDAGGMLQYTPALNANGSADLVVALHDDGGTANGGVDTSPTQIITVTVNAVDNAPQVSAGGTLAYTEGDPAAIIDNGIVLSDVDSTMLAAATVTISTGYQNGADVLGFTSAGSITGTWNATTGSLALTGIDSLANYQAALRSVTYLNTSADPSTAPRSVTWTVNDGSSDSSPATSTVTVTAVDDAPVLAGTATLNYTENDAATAIFTAVTVADSDSARLASATVTISSGFQTSEDVLGFSNDGSSMGNITASYSAASGVLDLVSTGATATVGEWQAALRQVSYFNSSNVPSTVARSVTFEVHDGVLPSNTLVASVLVASVNDVPVVTAGAALSYTEGDGSVVADAGITVSDADNPALASASVAVTGNFASPEDELGFANDGASMGNIAASYDAGTGVLTLTSAGAAATLGEWQAALRGVTYNNPSSNPSNAVRTLSWIVNDGTDASAGATSTVAVIAINTAPSFIKGADQTVNEDAGAQSLPGWASSLDDGDGGGQSLSFAVTGNSNTGLFASGPAVAADGTLSFTPAANVNGSATITLVLQDNGGTTGGGSDTSAPQSFTITVNAVNDAPGFAAGGNQSVLENAGAQSVPNWVGAISAGPANESSQTVSFQVTGNSNAALFSVAPAIASDGTLTYTPAPDVSGTATLTVVAKDSGGTANGGVDTSAAQTFTITVLFVNDAPSFTAGGNVSADEDSGAYSAPWASAVDDGDPDVVQVLTFTVNNDNNALFAAQPAISAGGVLSFTPAANASGTASLTVTLKDDGGTANGGVDTSTSANVTITVNPVNDAPSALVHSVQTSSGVAVTIAAGDVGSRLKDGASDPDDPPGDLAVSGTFTNITPAGATVTLLDAATGTYTYDPPPGYSGAASFDYRVCDDGAPTTPVQCAGNTVTVTVTGPDLWFVDPTATANGVGRMGSPFNSLASVPSSRGTGDRIFVYSGSASSGITLNADERLIGQGASGSFDILLGVSVPTIGTLAARPTLGGTAPILAGTVALADNSQVQGVSISSGSATGLLAAGKTGFSVSETSVSATTTAVDMSASAAATAGVTLTSTTSSGGGLGIRLENVSGGDFDFGTGSLSGQSIAAISVAGSSVKVDYSGDISAAGSARPVYIGTSSGAVTLSGAVDSTGNGIRLVGNTGGTIGFTGELNLSTAANVAFEASGGGTVSASDTGSTLTTTTNQALRVTATSIGAAGLHFRSISAGTAASGPSSGIVLDGTGSAGGLVVHGSGSPVAVGSGGLIQKTTGPGISLTSTVAVELHGVSIQNTAGSGIAGTTVAGFVFDRGNINGSGSGNGDANIDFNVNAGPTASNVSGTFKVTDSTLDNALWHGIDIVNTSGTLDDVVITGNNLSSSTTGTQSRGSAISIQALGSATTAANITKASISNNSIANFPSDGGILVHGGNSTAAGPANRVGTVGSSTDVVAINGNQIRGASTANRMNTHAISAIVSGNGQGNFDISNNGTMAAPLRDIAGTVILVGTNGPAITAFKINDNVIEAHNSFSSNGIGGGAGSLFGAADVNSMTVEATGNNISQTDGNGILLVASGGTNTLRASVKGNVILTPLSTYTEGIRVDSGNINSAKETVCLDISGNTTSGSTGMPGIGLRKQGTDPVLNAFGIVGMAAATSSPAVENYVNVNNPGSASGTFGVGGTDLISATSGFTNCSIP